MSWYRRALSSLAALVGRRRLEDELDQELAFHLDMETDKLVAEGRSPEDARREAVRRFGGVEPVKVACRDARGTLFWDDLGQDLRFAVRTLVRSPGFTTAAVLTLALGLGANAALFSVFHGVLLAPLPYDHADRLVTIRQAATGAAGFDEVDLSILEVDDYRAQTETFEALAEFHSMSFTLLGMDEPDEVTTGIVSADFFDVLGVEPHLGRTFVAADDAPGAPAVLVLSHEYWQRRFGGDKSIVGRVFEMNDKAHLVVGVLPPLPAYPADNDVYMPTSACPSRARAAVRAAEGDRTAGRMLGLVGRLEPGVPLERARLDVENVAGRFQVDHPDIYPDPLDFAAWPVSLGEELTRGARPTLLLLLGTALLVLLIACANVANLTLARHLRRSRELAVRSALGAGRRRLVRQLLTESLLLAFAGGLLGLGLAVATVDVLARFAARFTPHTGQIEVDGPVWLFTLGLASVAGLVLGLAPAVAVQKELTPALQNAGERTTSSSGGRRLRNLLVVSQLAISCMLLIGAGLTLRSLYQLQNVDPGFDSEGILTFRVPLNWTKYDDGPARVAFFERLLDRLESHPQIERAAVTTLAPLVDRGPWNRTLRIEGEPSDQAELRPPMDFRPASPGYFEILGVRLLDGRTFTEGDHAEAPPVAVVNRSLARQIFGDHSPLGRRISMDDGETWLTIVGLVGDVRQYGLDREPTQQVFAPLAQSQGGSYVLVKAVGDPSSLRRDVTRAVWALDPQQPVERIRTLAQVRAESVASPRLTALLLGLFAALALAITTTGISGVVAYTVARRTHEIGIRLALGARPSGVLGLLMRQGLALTTAGLLLGLLGAWALARLIASASLLFEVEATDPIIFATVALLLALVATVASFVPARRAIGIDPVTALKLD